MLYLYTQTDFETDYFVLRIKKDLCNSDTQVGLCSALDSISSAW